MMQELLGQTNFVGRDGFYWWIGQIETQKGEQVKGDDRYKVRIVGQHLKDCNAVAYEDLPWAIVMMPPTAPRREGGTDYQNVKYQAGDWVIGFFLDGNQGQQPVIIGSIGKQFKATTNNGKEKPAEKCLAFTSFVDPDVNPQAGVPATETDKVQQSGVSGTAGGTTTTNTSSKADLNGPVNTKNENASKLLLGTKCCNADTNPAGEQFCVEISDAKCTDAEKDKNKLQTVLTELFGNISNNGGQLGTSIVGKYTGVLYDYTAIAQGYINKVMRLAKSSVARIKGEVYALIKQGAKEIIDFLLTEEVVDLEAPEQFNGPYADPAKAVSKPKKRVGRLRGLTKWINDQLKSVNCQLEDLDERLMEFIEELIYGFLDSVFSSVTCVIDKVISDIISQIEKFLNDALAAILGPLETVLGIIASPLDIIGQALAAAFDILGISCGGPSQECSDTTKNCSGNCGGDESDGFGLDDIIEWVENGDLAPESLCAESFSDVGAIPTTASLIGGRPSPTGFTGTTTATPTPTSTSSTLSPTTFSSPTGGATPAATAAAATAAAVGSTITPSTVAPVTTPPTPTTSAPTLALLSPLDLDYVTSTTPFATLTGGLSTSSFVMSTALRLNHTGSLRSSITSLSLTPSSTFTPVIVVPTNTISYALSINKSLVFEGESVTVTLVANGGVVPDGTVFNYLLFGSITSNDFVGGQLTGTMTMVGNIATTTIVIEDDTEIEGVETVSFNVLETGSTVPFTIAASDGATTTSSTIPAFTPSILGTPEVCDDGRIMEIPILQKGDPYIVPPLVIVEGGGYGASAVAELDAEGFLSKIKVQRGGTGYTPTRTRFNCVISEIVVASPGVGYYGTPNVFVNGRSNIARAITTNGIVTGIDIINKTQTFNCTPKIEIIGGDGLGARAFAIMECRDDKNYQEFVQNIAPSGVDEVIDCP